MGAGSASSDGLTERNQPVAAFVESRYHHRGHWFTQQAVPYHTHTLNNNTDMSTSVSPSQQDQVAAVLGVTGTLNMLSPMVAGDGDGE